jgi:uracil phosphoribosyltransferase
LSPLITNLATLHVTQNVKNNKNRPKTYHKKFGIITTLAKEKNTVCKTSYKHITAACASWNNKKLQKKNIIVMIIIMNYYLNMKMTILATVPRVRLVNYSSLLCHRSTEKGHTYVKTYG